MSPDKLRVIDAEPMGEGIIERLEWALEMAKDGKLSSVAIAVVERDGSPDWRWSDAPNVSLLIGSIERMKHRILIAQDDE